MPANLLDGMLDGCERGIAVRTLRARTASGDNGARWAPSDLNMGRPSGPGVEVGGTSASRTSWASCKPQPFWLMLPRAE